MGVVAELIPLRLSKRTIIPPLIAPRLGFWEQRSEDIAHFELFMQIDDRRAQKGSSAGMPGA
jgi:hypothetical protein